MTATVGFVGAGQMARALASGLVAAELVAPADIVASDAMSEAAEQFAALIPGCGIAADNRSVVRESQTVVLAVKPQSLANVIKQLDGAATPDKLFVSIVAGAPLATLTSGLQTDRVVRVMPNTPSLIGSGAAAYALGSGASAADGEWVAKLLRAVGLAFEVDEPLLDAVTGLSGSGPAYVYTMIEALSDGGVRAGLPRAVATSLAAQTVLGAARMVLSSGEHPSVLKDRVTSPGGTTIAGLQVLERHGFRAALIDAVEAAAARSRELGRSS